MFTFMAMFHIDFDITSKSGECKTFKLFKIQSHEKYHPLSFGHTC